MPQVTVRGGISIQPQTVWRQVRELHHFLVSPLPIKQKQEKDVTGAALEEGVPVLPWSMESR